MDMQGNKKYLFIIFIIIITIIGIIFIKSKYNIIHKKESNVSNLEEININNTINNTKTIKTKEEIVNELKEVLTKLRGNNYIDEYSNKEDYITDERITVGDIQRHRGFSANRYGKKGEVISKEEFEGNIEKILNDYNIKELNKVKSDYLFEFRRTSEEQGVDYILEYKGIKEINNEKYEFYIRFQQITNEKGEITDLNSGTIVSLNKIK